MYVAVSLVVGIVIGALLPVSIPARYSIYIAVLLLAALDAAAGGLNAHLHRRFRASLFLSGALGNGLIAVFLTYMGERIGIALYLASVVVFGTRLFQNFGEIRRELLILYQKCDKVNKYGYNGVEQEKKDGNKEG